ncbi:lysophospholipid acyltransferase family protein [Candidatus Leptofilum sp.]|uniref:lysophospholipid acyltransferase family protein n=1 Tax=Candidatus Leptofilum sp. TaxID=3241576 RepID=UPI003B5A1F1F
MTNDIDQLPQRGNRFSRAVAAFLFKITGWQVAGSLPNLPKMIVIGAPHTTNWDFPLAMNLIFYLGIRINWMAKAEFFVKPFSYLWGWLGGVPVDRSAANGTVGQTIDAIQRRAKIILAIAPEGTRSKVNRWRTGFYHIAHGAEIPIVPVLVDYGRKILTITEPFMPTGDVEADLPLLQARYKGIQGKNQTHF